MLTITCLNSNFKRGRLMYGNYRIVLSFFFFPFVNSSWYLYKKKKKKFWASSLELIFCTIYFDLIKFKNNYILEMSFGNILVSHFLSFFKIVNKFSKIKIKYFISGSRFHIKIKTYYIILSLKLHNKYFKINNINNI